jgi:methanogenic corrinoid protein MtbC1/transposase-like protein
MKQKPDNKKVKLKTPSIIATDTEKDALQDGYSMQVAARRSGVSPHLIRMWERRYSAVVPRRTPSGRRLYSDSAIEKLRLLLAATQAGHNISSIASLSSERLREIVRADADAPSRVAPKAARGPIQGKAKVVECSADYWLNKSLEAVRALDAGALRSALDESLVALGRVAALEQVIAPLMETIGDLWRRGELRVMHEHLAAAGARSFLSALTEMTPAAPAPLLLSTTLPGQMHEIGAMLVAATAASEGWRAIYLGPDLPPEEVVAAVRDQPSCRVLALSFVFPPDDERLPAELCRLGDFLRLDESLPENLVVIAGGRSVENYAAELDALSARRVPDLQALRTALEELRN